MAFHNNIKPFYQIVILNLSLTYRVFSYKVLSVAHGIIDSRGSPKWKREIEIKHFMALKVTHFCVDPSILSQ